MEDQIPDNVFTLDWNERMRSLIEFRDAFKNQHAKIFEDPSVYIALDFMGMPQESVLGRQSMSFKPCYSDNLPGGIRAEFEAALAKYLLK